MGGLVKRIGQLVTLVLGIFAPMPVPQPVNVWPRIIVAVAIVIAWCLSRY